MALKALKRPTDLELKKAVIANAVAANAVTLKIGDVIQPGATGHNKFVVNAASTGLVSGVIVALEFAGKIMEVDTVIGVNTASTAAGAAAINVHNDNETTGFWKVVFIPSNLLVEYEADLSAAADTTTDSGGKCFLSLVSGTPGTLDETSVALFGGTAGQFWSNGVTTYSTTKVIGHIYKTL